MKVLRTHRHRVFWISYSPPPSFLFPISPSSNCRSLVFFTMSQSRFQDSLKSLCLKGNGNKVNMNLSSFLSLYFPTLQFSFKSMFNNSLFSLPSSYFPLSFFFPPSFSFFSPLPFPHFAFPPVFPTQGNGRKVNTSLSSSFWSLCFPTLRFIFTTM